MTTTSFRNHDPLQVQNCEWYKVEEGWDVKASDGFVDHSGYFVEYGSFRVFDIFTPSH